MMDPNAALERMRRLVKAFDAAENDWVAAQVSSELIDMVVGLDDWMSRGGYLPADWKRA